MLASTSRQSHCGEAELTWLKMSIRFLWINTRAWPVNSDNPGNRVRVMRWCLRDGSKGHLQEANSGNEVGAQMMETGWGRREDGRICLRGEQRKIKVERERRKTGGLWREKESTQWLDGRAVKDWAGARNEMCWVSCPFFWNVWFVCEPMICVGLWVHLVESELVCLKLPYLPACLCRSL